MSYFYNHKTLRIFILFFSLALSVSRGSFVWAAESNASQPQAKAEILEGSQEKESSKDLELIDFANGLFQRNFYEMALTEYKKFIALYPESDYLDDAYFGIAESLFFLKSYPKAIGAYNSYKEFYPQGEKIVIANLRLGQSLFYTGSFERALDNLNQVNVKQLDKDFVPVFYLYQGKVLAHEKKGTEASVALNKVLELGPQGDYPFLALIELAELSNRQEDYIQAIEYYKKAQDSTQEDARKAIALYKQGEIYLVIKRHKEAINAFEAVLKQYSQSDIAFDAFSNLLIALYNLEEYEKVLAQYQKREKEFQGKPSSKIFKLYYILATAHVQLGDFIGALTVLDNALALEGLEPADVHKALIKKTEILVKIQKFDIALSIITDQLSESTEEADNLLFLQAESLYGLEKYQDAFDAYKAIREQYEGSSLQDDALYSMAHAKSKANELTDAAILFFEYFQEGNNRRKKEEALYNLILIQKDLNDLGKTIEYSEIFIDDFQESPNKEKILFLLGTLYQKNKQFDKAIVSNKKFIENYPESDRLNEVYFLLAFNLQSVKKFDESLKYYQKLNNEKIDRNLRYPALKNSALIYISQENKDMAAKTFNEIVSLYEDNDLRLDTYIWLAEHYFEREDFKPMLEIVERAETKINDENREKTSQVTFLKAQALLKTGHIQKAMKNYRSIIQNEKDVLYKAASRIGLGLCYVEKKMIQEAKTEFETAILENTEDNTITMRARFEIANMYWELKEYEKAVKFYMFVSVLYDDELYCSQSLYKAGQSFEAVGKNHDALKVYDELVIRYPSSLYYQKALKRIEALDEI